MKKTINYNKEISIEDNVSSITSISLECSYNENRNNVDGIFLIEGSYKTHELSLNKKDFRFELPFNNELENIKEETANIEIEDFTYELEDNVLKVNIDYAISYEEEEIQEAIEEIEEIKEEFNEEEFERFLSEHEVDVISFNDSNEIENEETNENAEIEEIEEIDDEEDNNLEREEAIDDEETRLTFEPQISDESVEETLLNNISKEEKYITYHVYVCENDDTMESISQKFNISKDELRGYNDFDEIKIGLKLIIPVKDE